MPEMNDYLDEVPPKYRERFVEMVELLNEFCDRYLNDEYKVVCRDMAFQMCQETSPVLRGKAVSWASGVMYAVGRVNFLMDPNSDPHMSAEEIAAGFGVSPATMYAKQRVVRDGLELMPLDPDFTIASRVDGNPLIWMLTVNGYLMDIRHAPREAQVVAYENGLIPYIPADREQSE